MGDPIKLAGSVLGGALLGGLFGGNNSNTPAPATPAPTNTPPPDQSQPAVAPGTKPAQKNSQQQSFLSGAAALQSAGRANVGGNTGSGGGKSLLGQ